MAGTMDWSSRGFRSRCCKTNLHAQHHAAFWAEHRTHVVPAHTSERREMPDAPGAPGKTDTLPELALPHANNKAPRTRPRYQCTISDAHKREKKGVTWREERKLQECTPPDKDYHCVQRSGEMRQELEMRSRRNGTAERARSGTFGHLGHQRVMLNSSTHLFSEIFCTYFQLGIATLVVITPFQPPVDGGCDYALDEGLDRPVGYDTVTELNWHANKCFELAKEGPARSCLTYAMQHQKWLKSSVFNTPYQSAASHSASAAVHGDNFHYLHIGEKNVFQQSPEFLDVTWSRA
ncbi:hypothetical protein K438DRAFT_1767627 [Mycena galopus ATCC 62051]|nr:hypothetical protein K438DRAFT_1767627 [Mycena galopus ATCC 62051]